MSTLLQEIRDNLGFLAVCIAIAAALFLLSHIAERFLPARRRLSAVRRLCLTAICGAVATVLFMLEFPLPFLAPSFYELDLSEIPVMLCGFYLGPSAAVGCEALKIVLKLLLKGTSTAFVGDFSNFVVGCALVLPAVIVYHAHKSKKSALCGLMLGTLLMTVFGSVFNAVYLLPKFSELYGIPLDAIIAMGGKIHAGVSNVSTFVLLCVVPWNLLKGCVVSLLTLLLYKRVARPLFGLAE